MSQRLAEFAIRLLIAAVITAAFIATDKMFTKPGRITCINGMSVKERSR